MTTKMTKKILGGALVALMTVGLAGCAESTTPATKTNHLQTAKVTQAPSAKKAGHATSVKANTETKQAASQPASQVTTNQTSASYTAQHNVTPQQNVTPRQAEQVANQFTQVSGIKQQAGQTYTITQPNAKEGYQIDVRDNNGDPNVSHLEGIYKFNPQTNTVQQMNPMTGKFEDK